MAAILEEANRFVDLGIAILPIPHGFMEPRFDWTAYQRKAPSRREIADWLESRVGIGAICGRVSQNLVALEFTAQGAYHRWSADNKGLAARLPTIRSSEADYVLFRTDTTTDTSDLFLPGSPARVGRVRGEGSLVPFPPTLCAAGTPRSWINGLIAKNLPNLISIDEVGILMRPLKIETEGAIPEKTLRKEQDQSHNYSHVFKTPAQFRSRKDREERKWVVEGLLPETFLAILAGTSKSGKSCLATALALAVANGEPFLGLKTVKSSILWVAYEESVEERSLVLDHFPEPPTHFYTTVEKLHIDTPEGIDTLRWWIRNTNAKLLVIDPLYAATVAESLSDGRTARDSLSKLKELCRTEGCAALVLHHITKNVGLGMTRERFADSNQILATASMDLLMDHVTKADGSREIRLQGRGRGEFANRTWIIASTGVSDFRAIANGAENTIAARARDETLLAPLRESSTPLTSEQIAGASGERPQTVRNRLTELVREGTVLAAGKDGHAALYKLRTLPIRDDRGGAER